METEELIEGKTIEEGKREWCCWTLSEEEILKAAEGVEIEIAEDDIELIVVTFKKYMSDAFSDWEEALEEAVKHVAGVTL